MAAYHRVYDSRHLQADCQEPRSAPGPYARQSSMGCLYLLMCQKKAVDPNETQICWPLPKGQVSLRIRVRVRVKYGVKFFTLRNQPHLRGHKYVINKQRCSNNRRTNFFAIESSTDGITCRRVQQTLLAFASLASR